MTKQEAMDMFGAQTLTELARELEVTPALWHQMSDPIPVKWEDRLIGLAVKRGLKIPSTVFRHD